MKIKKSKLILIISLSILLIGLIVLFFTMNNFNGKENLECKIVETLELKENNEIPTIYDFVTNCNTNGTIEFYQNNELIELENLVVGSYEVKIIIDKKTYFSKLIVKEKEEEEELEIDFKLKDVTINENDTYDIDMFIDSCNEECILSFSNEEMANYKEAGTYDIEIILKQNDVELTKRAKLTIVKEDKQNIDTNNIESTTQNNNQRTNTENSNQNDNNNQNNTTNTTNDTPLNNYTPPVSNTPSVVDSTSEETRTDSYKYGTTITKITTSYYDLYSDNSKVKTGETSRYEYNYSTFNGTTDDLKAEAASLVNSNMSSLNEVVNYVNQFRNEMNVQNINLDYDLSVAATVRALEIGWSDTFSHTRPNGTSCFTVFEELGITYYMAGENIAMGYTSPNDVSNAWKNSQGHYENMINSGFNKIGVGLAIINNTYYWVQLFTN